VQIGVLGINFKLANVEDRENVAKTFARRFGPFNLLHPPGDTFVPLCTCNRSEIYFSSQDLASTHSYLINLLRRDMPFDFDQKLYSYFEGDCFWHLARVTTGLDSARRLETEIQGQVKDAYEKSSAYQALTRDLHFLFQKSLKIGKRVRSQINQSRTVPDIDEPAVDILREVFSDLNQISVLFVGASEINCKIIRCFKKSSIQNISLCNRMPERALLLALREGIRFVDWSQLEEWYRYDVVVLATKSSEYLITEAMKRNVSSHKVFIDVSVPRNVDPELAQDPLIKLVNIDQLDRMISYAKELASTEVHAIESLVRDAVLRELNQIAKRASLREHICLATA
jgi:glutamyl-tRNA reductase